MNANSSLINGTVMIRFFFISFIFFLFSTVYGQEKWKLEKEEEGVTAYSRIKKGTDYYEFRTIFEVKGTLEQARKLIMNVDSFKNWLPSTVDSKILKKLDSNSLYGYTVTAPPWPASKRDLVFKLVYKSTDVSSFTIQLLGNHQYIPIDKEKVRVEDYFAEWKISLTNNLQIKVDYKASFKPNGNQPNWLLKNSMIDARIKTAQNFKEEIIKIK